MYHRRNRLQFYPPAEMNIIKFLKRAATTPPGLLGMGIIATLVFTVSYRVLLKPEMSRRRRQEAETAADYLFQQDLKRSIKNVNEDINLD
uniref:Uncharacterized protein n=1 Tax=Glossina palpalis gambiensis TaxID=67801 RepID=A0A1B0BVM5_9MUSC